ncbi:HNH/ENDO VII family nuclease [Microvirga arabica]
MLFARAPWGVDGHKVVLHHQNQNPNGPLDELTKTEHGRKGLHGANTYSINRYEFGKQRDRYWVSRARKHIQDRLAGRPALYELEYGSGSARLTRPRPPSPDRVPTYAW